MGLVPFYGGHHASPPSRMNPFSHGPGPYAGGVQGVRSNLPFSSCYTHEFIWSPISIIYRRIDTIVIITV